MLGQNIPRHCETFPNGFVMVDFHDPSVSKTVLLNITNDSTSPFPRRAMKFSRNLMKEKNQSGKKREFS